LPQSPVSIYYKTTHFKAHQNKETDRNLLHLFLDLVHVVNPHLIQPSLVLLWLFHRHHQPKWSTFNGPKMTNDPCISFCDAAGFPVAGTEYAGQCFCGVEITSTEIGEDKCNMPCTGKQGAQGEIEMCCGSAALSVWTKTASASAKVKRHVTGSHLRRHFVAAD
jgi:hypothetical protein